MRWGVQITSVQGHSDMFEHIAVKGDPAWEILQTLGEGITTTECPTSMTGFSYKAPPGWLLTGIDDSQETLAMWYFAYNVFKVGKKTKYPTPEQIRAFPGSCFDAFLTFRARASRERFLPDYLHIIYFHGPEQLKHFGSLDVMCNQDTEAANKDVLRMYQKTQHAGSIGRISEAKKQEERRAGVSIDHTYGRSNQNEGLRGLFETWTVKTSCRCKAWLDAMPLRQRPHSPDEPPEPAADQSPSPAVQAGAMQLSPRPEQHDNQSNTNSPMSAQGTPPDQPPPHTSSPLDQAGSKHPAPRTNSSSKARRNAAKRGRREKDSSLHDSSQSSTPGVDQASNPRARCLSFAGAAGSQQ